MYNKILIWSLDTTQPSPVSDELRIQLSLTEEVCMVASYKSYAFAQKINSLSIKHGQTWLIVGPMPII